MMPHIPRSAFHFVNCPLDSWYYFVKLHSFTIRQYRILPCRFLQCIPHGKPPCVVLILPISFRAYKGLAPSGKKTPAQSFVLTKNSCIFGFVLLLCSRCALLMQGTHRRLAQWRVSWLIEHSTSYQLLWCIESFVFRNSPHCLLRERQQKPPITCNQTL